MAPFNWFNRQFSESSDSEAESSESTEATEPITATSTSEPSQETQPKDETPAVAQDQLSWAKLAYENIRKRQAAQGTEASTEVASEAASEAVSEVASEAAPVESAIEPAPVSTEAPIAEVPVSALDAPAPEVVPTAAPLPFWAQAEAERLERLERLKQDAIAAEAPVTTTETAPVANLTTALTMDEGFLWSAEVLAAQGRRPEDISIEEITWLKRLRQGLDKTRRSLVNQLRAIVGQGPLNQDAVTEIESLLLQADVGVVATDYIIESLQTKLRQETLPPSEAIAYLKTLLQEMLDKPLGQNYEPVLLPEKDRLNIWLVTGVNGAGKTTTIGKLTHIAQKSGYRCLIAAADTFRAAAVQQVQVWGDRSNVEVIANPGKNTDPAAVVFDAIAAAQARGTELLIVDTAGRLQNKKNLMDELSKIRRIIDKKAPGAKVESLLVLDSTLGQNGLRQAEVFSEAAQVSGVVLTKLDGTAKGGIALAVVQQLGLPIRFIGAGEGIEDLRPFSSYEFVEALLSG
ncbi:MAG: signal recognition particle-docking protein FtsY [Drouetiella hepatica Uher 2000/2452]|jgi:fused signal recognition particle receptor|uniref:Signal recognition particle receptor FtsY n=1 Tax=Drouetiella hepatica Uher 2000/2452 TaxID=904376 RepID=A0A951QE49_9CYAN|nr:signal recognition particle-docking protein FtsY [Drouetiella hepatica Uher 2000/2452]